MAMVIPRPGTTVEEVHCYNKTTDDAVTLIIDSSYDTVTCKIPDTFLTTSNDLVFYAVMKDDTGKYTTEKALFKVIKRPKPSGYVYTEEEVREWELLNSRMSELEQNSVTDSWNYTRGMLIGENEAIKDELIPDDILRKRGVVWSDITDRPFGNMETGSELLSWDGDTTGLVTDSGGQYFKVSGVTPKSEYFKSKPAEYCYVMEDGRDHSISGSGVNEIDNIIDIHGYCIIVSKDGAQYEERTFPEAGTYFKKISETHYCYGLKIVGYTGFPYVKCIDDVYISENISREGHTHDWELLENKPIVETCEFEFSCDGNTEGLTMLYGFAKISDLTPALEDFKNGLRIHRALGDTQDYAYEDVTVGNMFGVSNLIIGPRTLFVIIPEGTIGPGGTTFEKGIYFCNQGGYNHTVKVGIKQIIRPDLIEEPNTEEWVFTLEDGSTVTKKVAVMP